MTKHRLLACLLVLCLLLGSVPAGLAEGGSGSSSDLVQLIREKLNKNNTPEETAPEAPAADAAPAQEAPAQGAGETAQQAGPGLPVFIRQPMDRTVRLNSLAVMDADVDGADSYQWQYSEDNGLTWNNCARKFTGANTIRVLFTAKENMHGWLFRLAATNSAGTVYSDTAVLTIEGLPVNPPAAEEPASEEPAAEEPATEEPAAEEPASEEPAAEEPAAEEPAAEEPAAEEPASEEPAAEEPAAEEPAAEEPAAEAPAYDLSDPFAEIDDDFDAIEINEKVTPATITKHPQEITVAPGQPAKYNVVAYGSGTLIYQWQYSWDGNAPWGNLTNSDFWTGNKTDELEFVAKDYYNNMYIRCAVKVKTSEGTSVEVWSNSVQIHVSNGPTIINQPQDVTVSKDTKTAFTVNASGNGTLSYKWEYRTTQGGAISLVTDNGDMQDSTLNILKVVGKLAFDGYQFRCKVTDSVGTIYSDWATLHIQEAAKPEIIVEPSPLDITVFDGDDVTVSLVAVNATKYQWQYDKGEGWKDLAGGTYWKGNKTDTMTFMAAFRHDNMKLRCKVSNDASDTVYSKEITLHVVQLPVIVTDPADQSVTSGDPVTFSITATGATKYQWQCSYDGGLTWVNLTNSSFWIGNKTPDLTFTTANRYNNYLFRCLAMNDAGTTASNSAKLTLTKSVVIKQQPQNQVSGTSGSVNFTVVAENAVSYEWERAPLGTNDYATVPSSFIGWNTDTLVVPATAVNASYKYRCKVTGSNPSDFKYTTAATITLLNTPNILHDPVDICVSVGQKATFSVSATGATGYQWQYSTDNVNWTNLTNSEYWVGNKASTLSFMAAAKYNNFYFRCLVSNAAGTSVSGSAKLCIMGMPVIINDPISRNVPVDAIVSMEVVATGAASYTWQYHNGVKWVTLNNTAIWSGVNTYRLVFQAKKYMDGYQFRCMVKNASGTVYSGAALLTVSAVIPPQPNNVNITGAAMSSLTVTWSKVVADELNGYKIYYSTVNDPSTAILYSIVDPTQKSCTIIGLTPMTNYYVWVSAYNTAGESALNSHVMATGKTMWADTDMIPPEAPSSVKAVPLNDYSVRLTWKRSPSAGVLGYLVYYSTQSLTSNAKLYGITGPTATSIVLQGLEPGTRYYIWVAAYDDGGMSLLSNSVLAIVTTTGNPVYPIVPVVVGYLPDPPINVAAQRLSDTEALVSWKRGTSADVNGYTIYYGLTSDPAASTPYATTDASVRNVTVVGLNPNYGYYFWVVSFNDVGECEMTANNRAYVNVLNPITVVYPPVGPLSVAASAMSSSRIVVTWMKSPSLDVDGYRVYYSTVNNPATAVPFASVDDNSTSVGVFGLKPLTRYFFWVSAYNDAGESDLDSTVSSSAWTLYH